MVRLNSSLSSLVARRKSPIARPIWPMISGSLAGPNTIRARTTISTSSSGPIPRKFIAAGLCPPYLASVDLKLLGAGQDFVGESGAVGAGDPHLAFRVRFGAGDTMHDVLAPFGVELRQHVVEQDDRQVANLGVHPIGFGELERENRQALLAARAVRVQVDIAQVKGEIVAVWAEETDGLVDLARGDARLVLAKARLQLLERGRRLGWRAGG